MAYVYATSDWEAELYEEDSFHALEREHVKEAAAVAKVLLL